MKSNIKSADEDLLEQCISIIKSERKANVALFQRRLHIGYSRGCELMDELSRRKVVGPRSAMEMPSGNFPILIELPPESAAAVPYTERAEAMRGQEREALKVVLTEKFGRFLERVSDEHVATLEAFNLCREMGAQIELFTGHEKLLPDEFNFIQPALSANLPTVAGGEVKDAPIDFARGCLAAHQKFPEPVTNYAVAEQELERLLVQLQLIPKPAREKAEGEPPATAPVLNFLADTIKMAQSAVDIGKQLPIEKWEQFNRKSLITQGRPFYELYRRALELEGYK